MGFDYVFSNHETVSLLIGIAIAVIVVAVLVQRIDKEKEMKKPKKQL